MKNTIVRTITASAPGKLLLLGDHAVVYGYPCIVTAVNQRIFVTVTGSDDAELVITAPDVGISEYRKPMSALGAGDIPKGARFIETAVKNYTDTYHITGGVSVRTRSEFSSAFGFGSSSATVASVLAALFAASGRQPDNRALFDIAYKTVRDVQGVGSGFDVAAAIWGGTVYFTGGGGIIEPIPVPTIPLIVGYTGVKADTAAIVRDVAVKKEREPEKIDRIFTAITQLVNEGKKRMTEGEWDRTGKLMDFNQEYLRDLGVSSEKLESLIHAAMNAGAWGVKLSGAGGGDCMIALVSEEKKSAVIVALQAAGGTWLPVTTGASGVRIESTDNQDEVLDVVDADDTVVGTQTRYACHHNTALIHRTVGVLLYDSKHRLLLQKRSMTKDMEPGKWGISCAGHVGHGQSYDEAVAREMKEELGIDVPLKFSKKLLVGQTDETEIASLYTATSDGPFHLHTEEIDEVAFYDLPELQRAVKAGELPLTQGAEFVLKSLGVLL